jgi:phosphoribosyl-ATP pyrophosphohydrolase
MISGDDLEAFGYWDMVDAYPEKRPTILDMVEEFRVTMGQEKNSYLSAKLVKEEFTEWRLSRSSYDPKDELKELADLVYVIYGYANSLGWNLDEAVRRVHENNMGRCVQPDGTIKRRQDGKIIKNPEYPKVDLSDLI